MTTSEHSTEPKKFCMFTNQYFHGMQTMETFDTIDCKR